MNPWHVSDDGKQAQSDWIFWQSIESCPLGLRCLLKNNICISIGRYIPGAGATHWAPLPADDRRRDHRIVEHERRMEIYEAFKEDE